MCSTSEQFHLLYEIFLYEYFWPVINVDLKNTHFHILWVKLKKNGWFLSPRTQCSESEAAFIGERLKPLKLFMGTSGTPL